MSRYFKVAFAAFFFAACGQEQAPNVLERGPAIGTEGKALSTANGTTFNGISFGALSLSYAYSPRFVSPSLMTSLYVAPTSLRFTTDVVSGLGPNGTSFSDALSVAVSNAELSALGDSVGALRGQGLTGILDGGVDLQLRIDDIAVRADGRYSFAVSALDDLDDDDRRSLCGVDESGQPRRAIAVPGVWDTTIGSKGGTWSERDGVFSFACEGSTIEKCVRLGYTPEDRDFLGRPDKLLACVRMLRADYCGDGRSWTADGRLVEIWDKKGVNERTEPDWPTEAGWLASGASCLADARLRFPTESDKPYCLAYLENVPCGWFTLAAVWSSYYREERAVEQPVEQVVERRSSRRWSFGGYDDDDDDDDD